jgi:acyl-CoA hydrolase
MLAPAAAPLIELPVWSMEQIDRAIADHVARLIPDRVTIELGLGAIPQAVTRALGRKRAIRVHSGAIGDGIADLNPPDRYECRRCGSESRSCFSRRSRGCCWASYS